MGKKNYVILTYRFRMKKKFSFQSEKLLQVRLVKMLEFRFIFFNFKKKKNVMFDIIDDGENVHVIWNWDCSSENS